MRIWFMFPAVFLFCLLAANLPLAQADSITLKDGSMLIGDIVKTTNDSLTFKYQAGDDDEKTVTFRAEDLDPHSFYAARSEDLPDDPEAHISLAKFCAENRMFARCMVTYEQARAKFPDVMEEFHNNERVTYREDYAARLLEGALKARERGNLKVAEEEIQIIMTYLHDTKAGEEAKALIKKIALERLEQAETAAKEAGDDPDLVRIHLKDGTTLKGVVLETTEDSIRLQIPRGGGLKVTRNYNAGDIDPVTFCKIRSEDLGDDPDAYLKLIRFCIDHGIYTRGFFLYERLRAINPAFVEQFEKVELPELREKIGEELVASATDAMEEGRLDSARNDLAFVITRLEGTQTAAKARSLVEELAQMRMQKEGDRMTAKLTKLKEEKKEEEVKAHEEAMRIVDPAKKLIDRGRGKNSAALQKDKGRDAISKYESAAADFVLAKKSLETLMKKHEKDPIALDMITDLHRTAMDEAVGAYINAGRVYMNRTSFPQATKCANKAIDVNPDSSRAVAFRAEVQAAELAHAGDWNRKWGGNRPGTRR